MAEEADAKEVPGIQGVIAQIAKAFTKDSVAPLIPTRAIDGLPFEASSCAYGALDQAASVVAEAAVKANLSCLLVMPGDDVSDLSEYRTFLPGVDDLIASLEEDLRLALGRNKPSDGGTHREFVISATVVGALVTAGVSLAGALLHRDVKTTSATITLEDDTLALLIFQAISKNGTSKALLANAFSLQFSDSEEEPATRLLTKLRRIRELSQKLQQELGSIEQELGPPPDPKAPTSAVTPAKKTLAGLKRRIEQSLAAVSSFLTSFGPIAHRMLRADEKEAFLRQKATGLLLVHVLVGGGSTRMVSNERESVSSGGVIVRYTLLGGDGTVNLAGVVEQKSTEPPKHSPFFIPVTSAP